MLYEDGIPTPEDLETVNPPPERLSQGPVVIIECFQKISCDPCHTNCSTGCILPFEDLSDLPRTEDSLCNGCGICVAACPGLAVFIVDMTSGGEGHAVVQIPWEYLPVPEKGQEVVLTNRAGNAIGRGECLKAIRFRDRTYVLHLRVPAELAMEARGIDRRALIESQA
jgi:Fe-S-cluster-containing hydrogenase component 2